MSIMETIIPIALDMKKCGCDTIFMTWLELSILQLENTILGCAIIKSKMFVGLKVKECEIQELIY